MQYRSRLRKILRYSFNTAIASVIFLRTRVSRRKFAYLDFSILVPNNWRVINRRRIFGIILSKPRRFTMVLSTSSYFVHSRKRGSKNQIVSSQLYVPATTRTWYSLPTICPADQLIRKCSTTWNFNPYKSVFTARLMVLRYLKTPSRWRVFATGAATLSKSVVVLPQVHSF